MNISSGDTDRLQDPAGRIDPNVDRDDSGDSAGAVTTGQRSCSPSSGLVKHVRALSETLESVSDEQLCAEVRHLRGELARGLSISDPATLVAGIALGCESLRRTYGVRLYDVQILAAMSMSRRCIAQMQTGEGKTFVALTAAVYLAMAGRGVHVITPNSYLARRDFENALPVTERLGLSAALLPERADVTEKIPAYDADITFGTGHEFGFDYLRDQLTLRQQTRQKLGMQLLRQLDPRTSARRITMQRGLCYAIVDEADSVLIDDAGSPLVLSAGTDEPAPDADAHRTAFLLAAELIRDDEYLLDEGAGRVVLTETGVRRSHAGDVAIPVAQLVRPWTEYVQQALRARHLFRRDVHFIVRDGEVLIVDETTGRIFEDRSWQDGLHQAIEAFEGLEITAEKNAVAQITRQRYFRLYDHLSGMTGTAMGCERELRDVYRLAVEEIPLARPSKRVVYSTRFFASAESRNRAVTEAAIECRRHHRAALIGTRSIVDSERLAAALSLQKIPFQLLNGVQHADEAEIISRAGQPGAITIATNLAGRGTDIALHEDVRHRGGLHVIVAECQLSRRMDRQLIGRCARQGDPGSAEMFVSAEDALITRHGPWLAAALRREADATGEVHADFSAQLARIQAAAERQQYNARISMLRRDIARDSLLKSMR